MASPHLLLWLLLAVAAEWKPVGEPDRRDSSSDLFYAKRTTVHPSDGRQVIAHLAFFTSRTFRQDVVDLGAGAEAAYPTLGDAFRAQGCVAGVNGGFFHPDWRPSGLVISRGIRINRFETGRIRGQGQILRSVGRPLKVPQPSRTESCSVTAPGRKRPVAAVTKTQRVLAWSRLTSLGNSGDGIRQIRRGLF
jgi:hypothetical protein